MNHTLTNFLVFTVGAAIGSAVTWKLVKDKYARLAQEEIAEMREYVRSKKVDREAPEFKEYEAKAAEYTSPDQEQPEETEEKTEDDEEDDSSIYEPYVIPPEEYGTLDYDLYSYTYTADGVLLDDDWDPIEDVDDVVGDDSLTHFGEFEPGSVYVRNDGSMADYEILLTPKTYEDIKNMQHPSED